MYKKILCLIATIVVATSITISAAPPRAMSPARLVNDFAGLFTPAQMKQLEDSLVAFNRTTSTQVAVVTLADLDNATPSQMAFDIMNAWGIGQKDKQNGIVILVKPRNETRGEVFIATGLGLEGILPDGRVTRIIDKVMVPHLKNGDYFAAVDAAASSIRAISRGEFKNEDDFPTKSVIFMFVGLFVLFIIFIIAQGKKNSGTGDGNNGSGGGGGRMFLPPIIGGFGGFGGGSHGGGGGGGFGGFGGGGSFGGGGGRSF